LLANLQDGVDVNQLSWYNPITKNYQAPSSVEPGEAYFINGLKQSTWAIQQQNAKLETLAQYFYDGDGGRVKKITPRGTTTYIGSLYEVTGSLKTKHIFMGPNRIATVSGTNPVPDTVAYFHSDHLGSSNIITNQAGNLIQNCEYLPYGEFSTKSGINATNYYFTGKELDDETGLMFFGARYYDPQIGRFITPDTIIQSPYDPQSFNRYSYCRNNPINLIDPTGHSFLSDVWDWLKDHIIDPIVNVVDAILSGDWKTIAIVIISIAVNVILPGSGTIASNFLLNVALHTLRGAAIGALTGGISSEIMGGNFWQGARVGLVAGAITGAIQGVTSSEQFKNWKSGNGFRSDDVVKAEQQRIANMKATLPQAKSADGAMQSATRINQASESGVAGQMGAELQGDSSFGWKGVYGDIKLQLNSTQPVFSPSNINMTAGMEALNSFWCEYGLPIGAGGYTTLITGSPTAGLWVYDIVSFVTSADHPIPTSRIIPGFDIPFNPSGLE